jgi:hypothetical protein
MAAVVSQGGNSAMPLSGRLIYVKLTFNCPYCGHALTKSGGWFQSVGRFQCAGCQREVKLTYDDKLALFKKHAHLVEPEQNMKAARPPQTPKKNSVGGSATS